MIVINGHVSAPAAAALATSTPRRRPKSVVFHIGAAFDAAEPELGVFGRATERSDIAVMVREVFTLTALAE